MSKLRLAIKRPIPVKFKLFEQGDEDGVESDSNHERYGYPYLSTKENNKHYGSYGEYYVLFGNHNDKWLVEKEIFEDTYDEMFSAITQSSYDSSSKNNGNLIIFNLNK